MPDADDVWRDAWRAAVEETAGAAPYLADERERGRAADLRRQQDLDDRRADRVGAGPSGAPVTVDLKARASRDVCASWDGYDLCCSGTCLTWRCQDVVDRMHSGGGGIS